MLKRLSFVLIGLIAAVTATVSSADDMYLQPQRKSIKRVLRRPPMRPRQEKPHIDPLNVVGATVGTIAGFGLGHPFQGRYLDRGWMFTTAELGGAVLFIAGGGIGDCAQSTNCQNQIATGIGGLIYIGARLFEIYDLWTHLRPEPQRFSMLILPTGLNGPPILALKTTF